MLVSDIKKLCQRKEFFILVTLGMLIAIAGLLESQIPPQVAITTNSSFSAFQAALIYDGTIAQALANFVLPALVIPLFSDIFFYEARCGVRACCLTRSTRRAYYGSKALAVFLSAFLYVVLIYGLNQLLCLIAFPTEKTMDFFTGNAYNNGLFHELSRGVKFPLLYMNNPGLLNVIHILYAGFYGACVALLSYTITLFFRKNRALTLLIPLVAIYVWFFAANTFLENAFIPSKCVTVSAVYGITSFLPSMLILCAVLLVCAGLVVYKCERREDEIP
jgi:hypothetical protein